MGEGAFNCPCGAAFFAFLTVGTAFSDYRFQEPERRKEAEKSAEGAEVSAPEPALYPLKQ